VIVLEQNDLNTMAEENLESIKKEVEYGMGTPDPDDIIESTARRFWGMTSGQRFLLALMVFLNVAVLGLFLLLASGRLDVPIP
jgi:hypothetical protein|tara:strand:+ start:192 stop:440 length:249 start_codon:yes stop_codon:yes gene_type:complete